MMIIFLDLITNKTMELENHKVDIINYTDKGIEVKDIEGNIYRCEVIELC